MAPSFTLVGFALAERREELRLRTVATTTMNDGTVKLKDLNDFLKPSDVCILPLGGGMQGTPKPGSFAAPMYSLGGDRKAAEDTSMKVARVTLSDCITCSGCVTSAETVLLDSETALRNFREGLSTKALIPAVCLSQQAVASLARKYGLSLQSAYRRLATFFRERGAARVSFLTSQRTCPSHQVAARKLKSKGPLRTTRSLTSRLPAELRFWSWLRR